jgi:hypothetical protein
MNNLRFKVQRKKVNASFQRSFCPRKKAEIIVSSVTEDRSFFCETLVREVKIKKTGTCDGIGLLRILFSSSNAPTKIYYDYADVEVSFISHDGGLYKIENENVPFEEILFDAGHPMSNFKEARIKLHILANQKMVPSGCNIHPEIPWSLKKERFNNISPANVLLV